MEGIDSLSLGDFWNSQFFFPWGLQVYLFSLCLKLCFQKFRFHISRMHCCVVATTLFRLTFITKINSREKFVFVSVRWPCVLVNWIFLFSKKNFNFKFMRPLLKQTFELLEMFRFEVLLLILAVPEESIFTSSVCSPVNETFHCLNSLTWASRSTILFAIKSASLFMSMFHTMLCKYPNRMKPREF